LRAVIDLQGVQGGAVFIGPGRQHRRALEQQERHRHLIGQQGKAFHAGARFGQQRVQRTVNVAGKLDLLGMDFNRLDLLTLQGVQAVVRHELG
jgi:hypothetical protein